MTSGGEKRREKQEARGAVRRRRWYLQRAEEVLGRLLQREGDADAEHGSKVAAAGAGQSKVARAFSQRDGPQDAPQRDPEVEEARAHAGADLVGNDEVAHDRNQSDVERDEEAEDEPHLQKRPRRSGDGQCGHDAEYITQPDVARGHRQPDVARDEQARGDGRKRDTGGVLGVDKEDRGKMQGGVELGLAGDGGQLLSRHALVESATSHGVRSLNLGRRARSAIPFRSEESRGDGLRGLPCGFGGRKKEQDEPDDRILNNAIVTSPKQ